MPSKRSRKMSKKSSRKTSKRIPEGVTKREVKLVRSQDKKMKKYIQGISNKTRKILIRETNKAKHPEAKGEILEQASIAFDNHMTGLIKDVRKYVPKAVRALRAGKNATHL
jgi:hypothetical protein